MLTEQEKARLGKWNTAKLQDIEAVALAARDWAEWDWNPNTSGADMEFEEIEETCDRLKTNLEKALMKCFGKLYGEKQSDEK